MKLILENFKKFEQKVLLEQKIKSFANQYKLFENQNKVLLEWKVNLYKATPQNIRDMIEKGFDMDPKFYNKEKSIQFVKDLGNGDYEAGMAELADRVKKLQTYTPPSGAPKRGDMPVIPPEKGALDIAKKLLNKGRIDVRPPYASGDESPDLADKEESEKFGKQGFGGEQEYQSIAQIKDPKKRAKYAKQLKKKGALQDIAERAKNMATKEIDPKQFPNYGGPLDKKSGQAVLNKGAKDETGLGDNDAVRVSPASIPAVKLFPSQSQIWLAKALGMAIGGVKGGDMGAIISQDNHILDGHHRWAATMIADPTAELGGVKAALDIGDLVPVLRNVGDAMGFPRRA